MSKLDPMLVDVQDFVSLNLSSHCARRAFVAKLNVYVHKILSDGWKTADTEFFCAISLPEKLNTPQTFVIFPKRRIVEYMKLNGCSSEYPLVNIPLPEKFKPEDVTQEVQKLLLLLGKAIKDQTPFDFE